MSENEVLFNVCSQADCWLANIYGELALNEDH